jgi:aminopeptidase-like protein
LALPLRPRHHRRHRLARRQPRRRRAARAPRDGAVQPRRRGAAHLEEDAPVDRVAAHVLRHEAPDNRLLPFSPYGYDERQYCSPGFDLPVGCLQRSVHGTFPEYHTSADDLDFVRPEHLARSFAALRTIAEVIEGDETLASTCPHGEPQLGRRGLYRPVGGASADWDQMALLWALNLADGRHSLLDVAERAGMPFAAIRAAADAAAAAGLLVPPAGERRAVSPASASGAS